MKEWRHEILRGLETMEVFLVYLTDDFVESLWCQQEVGFALGKGTPILSLKLEKSDPPGFIGNVQALKGRIDEPEASAASLYKLIGEMLNAHERLADGLVSAFAASEDYDQARYRFDRMKKAIEKLSDSQVATIVQAYEENQSLYRAIYLDNKYNRLIEYMESATDSIWTIEGKFLKKVQFADRVEDVAF